MNEDETEPRAKAGYRNPPAEHRFPDNPTRQVGRRPGSKNKPKVPLGLTPSQAVALEEGSRMLATSAGEMEANRAVNRAQIKTAAQGGTNAQKAHLARIDAIQQKKQEAIDAMLATYESYVRFCEDLLENIEPGDRERMERLMLPHPADVEVDFEKQTVRIFGPESVLERRRWTEMLELLAKLRARVLSTREELERDPENHGLQIRFDIRNNKYAEYREGLPARYRPEPLPRWGFVDSIKWYNELSQSPPRRRRRLVKNADLLEKKGVASEPNVSG